MNFRDIKRKHKFRKLLTSGLDLLKMGSASSLGAVTGYMVGNSIAGSAGIALGGFIGNIVQELATTLSENLQQNEKARLGLLSHYIMLYCSENESMGKMIRSDIKERHNSNRVKSSEILEGLFLKAKEQYEEMKLLHLGFFYSHIVFDQYFDMDRASYLLNLYGKLTYEQFCLMKVVHEKDKYNFSTTESKIHIDMILWQEILDLMQGYLIFHQNIFNSPASVIPSKLKLTDYGHNFHSYFGLDKIDDNAVKGIITKLEML